MSLSESPAKSRAVRKPKSAAAPRRNRGRPRLEEVEQRDAELLERALDHFMEKGFERTTLDAITSSLGMAKRTVYARYGNKHALFKTALRRAIDDWTVTLEALSDVETDDLEQTLIAAAQLLVGAMMSPAGLRLIRITNVESFRMPEIAQMTHGARSRMVTWLADLFDRRIKRRKGSDMPGAEELAVAFLNIISVPARLNAWGIPPSEADIDKLIRQRVRLFLRGALPR